MRNEAQVRGQIIAKRMNLLNNYLIKEANSGKSLPAFMAEKGITPAMFFSELPEEFRELEGGSREEVQAYADALNDLYYRQYLIYMGEGSYNAEGNIGNDPCGPNKCLHPTGSCVRCNKARVIRQSNMASCDGHSVDGLPVGEGVVTEGDAYYASGCGLPPIRPIGKEKKKNKDKWDKFRAKKAAYDKCRDAKKEDKKAPDGGKKGLHALNKFNPAFVLARNSFLSLVMVNFRNLAVNINKIDGKPHLKKKLTSKWYNLGGDVSKLRNAISKGKGKKPLFGKKKGADGSLSADAVELIGGNTYGATGVDDAAIVAWLTSAGGILVAIKPIIDQFKKEGGEKLGDEDPTADGGGGVGADIPEDVDGDGGDDTESFWTGKNIAIAVGVTLLIGGVIAFVAWPKKG